MHATACFMLRMCEVFESLSIEQVYGIVFKTVVKNNCMQNTDALVEILNDLVTINNDRVAGYQRAINESNDLDVDMKATFEAMIRESEQYKQDLTAKIRQLGGQVATGSTASGKIYRAWMDLKATFTGSDRKQILASCEYGEDAAQKAYESALTSDAEMPADVRQLIAEQQQALRNSHDHIKKYRDAHQSVN